MVGTFFLYDNEAAVPMMQSNLNRVVDQTADEDENDFTQNNLGKLPSKDEQKRWPLSEVVYRCYKLHGTRCCLVVVY